ncbi:hypothetical protein HMPREF3039_00462 [Akkermansia sp. KLE1798]|nr:hypothetical protein HMPREF3039_00462 [Akkermansia sp. KLE1798]
MDFSLFWICIHAVLCAFSILFPFSLFETVSFTKTRNLIL